MTCVTLKEAFPSEEICRNLLSALNLNSEVKGRIAAMNRLKEPICFESIIASSNDLTVCPRCSHFRAYKLRADEYPFKCTKCKKKFWEGHNTIFQGTRLALKEYFAAIFLHAVYENLTCKMLGQMIEVSERTAGEVLRKLKFIKNFKNIDTDKRAEEAAKVGIEFNEKNLSHNKYLIEAIESYLSSNPALIGLKKILNCNMVSFIPYSGSKRTIMDKLVLRLPTGFKNYFEVFVGGGALFFALSILKKLKVIDVEKLHISDYNEALIELYKDIKQNPAEFCKIASEYKEEYNKLEVEEQKLFFNKVRDAYNTLEEGVQNPFPFFFCLKPCMKESLALPSQGNFPEVSVTRISSALKKMLFLHVMTLYLPKM